MSDPTVTPDGQWRLQADGTWLPINRQPTALSKASDWIVARAGEKSTAVGALSAATISPELWRHGVNLAASLASGNYVGAAMEAIPLVAGLTVTIGAVIYPEENDNEKVKAAFAAMSRDELERVLSGGTGQD